MIETLTGDRARFAGHLFDIGAIKFIGPKNPDGFKLKIHETVPNAPMSPIYLNLRDANNPKPGPLHPHDYEVIAGLMVDALGGLRIGLDGLAPLPRAGDPFGQALYALLSQTMPLEYVELVKTDFPDGTRKLTGLAGDVTLAPGSLVLPVDDLITKAGTKVESIDVLAEAGYIVKHVIVLVDREQGGREELEKLGIKLISVFTLTELLDFYMASGRISKGLCIRVLTYIRANS